MAKWKDRGTKQDPETPESPESPETETVPIPIPVESEIQRAMRELEITDEMLDRRPGQRPWVDHGDRIVFYLLIKRATGGVVSREKSWPRRKS